MSLNANQQEAVSYAGHSLVTACPGSGKTRVISFKAEYILNTYPNANVVIVTFTSDSSEDIQDRLNKVAEKDWKYRLRCGTFHKLALDQLRQAGIERKIIHRPQVKQYVKRAMEQCAMPNIDLHTAIEFMERSQSDPDFEPADDDLGRIFKKYSSLLEQNHEIDFSGILYTAVRLMRRGELRPMPCNHLFCDEAQDIDAIQFSWCLEHIKAGAIITAVGDDDQSIYRFRRALGFGGMMRLHEEFNARIIVLDTNYRSRAEILNAAGELIQKNSNRITKRVVSHRGPGGTVEAWQCFGSANEANLIAQKIIESCATNEIINPERYSIGVKAREWAVLARNKHNLNHIAMALVANGIPHTCKTKSLWTEEPICFAVGLLFALVSETRAGFEAAMFHLGINQLVMTKIVETYGESLMDFVHHESEDELNGFGEEIKEKLVDFKTVVRGWSKDLKKQRVTPVILNVFNWFINHLNFKVERPDKRKAKSEIKLLRYACKLLSQMDGTLERRLQRVMTKNNGKNGNSIPGVFLGTLHSSKGLEYTTVWIAHADEGVLPDLKDVTKESLEEETRISYVGMTRAEDALFISCTSKPSRFIAEAGIKLRNVFQSDGSNPNRRTKSSNRGRA